MRIQTAPLLAAALVLVVSACTNGDDGPAGGDNGDEPDQEMIRAAQIERVMPDDDSPLVAGSGDEQLTINDVASNGSVVIAAGEQADESGDDRSPLLLRSADGRAWEAADDLPGGLTLGSAVATDDGFVVLGNQLREDPVVLRTADGATAESVPLAFPDGEQPFVAQDIVRSGDRLIVVGVGIEGLALSVSDDGGATWEPAELPDELSQLEPQTGVVLYETSARGSSISLTQHSAGVLLTATIPGSDGETTTVWASDEQGDEWQELGSTEDLVDGETLDLLYAYDDALLAFTSADGDAAVWRSDDGGGSFDRLEVEQSVFGGGGDQLVDAATTLDDGTLVALGRTTGEHNSVQLPAQLEVWVTSDLADWQRSLTDGGLAGTGVQQASGVAALGDTALVVGTHERHATEDEISDFEESAGQGTPTRRPPLARDGAAWVVTMADEPMVDTPLEVTPLEVDGIEGNVTINEMVTDNDTLIAAGWVEDDDAATAAVWTSADGESWERVSSSALDEPESQRIYGLTVTDDGVVAVGQTSEDGSNYLGVWTSPDGHDWSRSDLADPEFESSNAYGVVGTEDGLVAVGTGSSDDDDVYRTVGIWQSSDGGQSWSVVDTTGKSFQESNAEVLNDVEVAPDGTLIAFGHSGDAEDLEGGGFTYTPRSFVVESADGESWAPADAPFADLESGDVNAVTFDGEATWAFGRFAEHTDQLPGEPNVYAPGFSRKEADEWSNPPERLRHWPVISAVAPSPAGVVVAGSWWRSTAGDDALIGIADGDSVNYVTDGDLLADGDQEAVAVATLGEQVMVLGLDTSDEEPTVLGWSVTGR